MKRKLKQIAFLSVLSLALASSVSWAEEEELITCSSSTAFDFGGEVFKIPKPYMSAPNFVVIERGSRVQRVEAKVRHDTWITMIAEFEYDEKQVSIHMSNFNYPSIATGMIGGDKVIFACAELGEGGRP